MEDGVKASVSICIPILGREASLQRCLKAIEDNTKDWPHEVVIEQDVFGPGRRGCPRTLAAAVERARFSYICFLGNDTIPQPGWLRIAMECMPSFPGEVGIIGFRDQVWADGRCLHFVAAKRLLDLLDGFFLNPCYSHVGSDDEMIARARQMGRYLWCPDAIVLHDHFASGAEFDEVYKLAWEPAAVERDRATLKERAERMGFAPWLPK